jgi:hypothetical protein
MEGRRVPNPYARVVDREVFARNMIGLIEPMPTPELREFLGQCQTDNRGTEGEALMIQMIEDELERRKIARN